MARKSRFRSKKGYDQALQERTNKASGSRGGKWKPIFLSSAKFEKWVCREGDHIIDIIPYLDENEDEQYKLELLVHQRIGPDEGNYICPKTFDSRANCPLCSARAIAQAEEDDDLADSLRPRDRVVYNIVCYDSSKEEKKGVQVWEASSYLSEENFQAAAKKRVRGGGGEKVSFADPDNGRTISWERTGSGVGTRYVGVAMEERDESISDDILDDAYDLMDLLDIPSDETLQEQADIMLGSSSKGDTGDDVPDYDPPGKENEKKEEEKPSRTRRKKKEEPEDSEGDEKDPEEKPSRTRRTRRRR